MLLLLVKTLDILGLIPRHFHKLIANLNPRTILLLIYHKQVMRHLMPQLFEDLSGVEIEKPISFSNPLSAAGFLAPLRKIPVMVQHSIVLPYQQHVYRWKGGFLPQYLLFLRL